jgi:hypothetical protein
MPGICCSSLALWFEQAEIRPLRFRRQMSGNVHQFIPSLLLARSLMPSNGPPMHTSCSTSCRRLGLLKAPWSEVESSCPQ